MKLDSTEKVAVGLIVILFLLLFGTFMFARVAVDRIITPPDSLDSDRITVLDALLNDLLNNPELQDSRDFYGTPGDKNVVLIDDPAAPLPKGYHPSVPGFKITIHPPETQAPPDADRQIGICIDKLNLEPAANETAGLFFDAPIEARMFNAGGSKNGGVIGGCIISYRANREHDKWQVQWLGMLDP